MPAIRIRNIRRFDKFGNANIGNRRANAQRPLAILPAAQRPGQPVQRRVSAPFIRAFHQRAVRTATARISAVFAGIVNLNPPPNPLRLWHSSGVKLAIGIETEPPKRVSHARQLMRATPSCCRCPV